MAGNGIVEEDDEVSDLVENDIEPLKAHIGRTSNGVDMIRDVVW